uniref:Protein kinase domain-containing protein n=1 Tax=Cyclophora tenuis TaxID=216820 RepID=A0A7S1GIQ0_CYCTE
MRPLNRSKDYRRHGANVGSVPSYTPMEIAQRTNQAIESIQSDLPAIHIVPRVNEADIVRLNPLGEGGYCKVERVSWNGRVFALKELKSSTLENEAQFRIGFKDISVESAVLAGLDHPNIIQIHGAASGSIKERIQQSRDGNGFFLLMDKVDYTLESQLRLWMKEGCGLEPVKSSASASVFQLFQSNHSQFQVDPASWNLMVKQRLPVALEIAQGLAYLHKHRVMYRDLKPDNVGLKDGHVKILDFGLATTDIQARECAGSRRYMAPEVVLRKRYTKAVDVYSFGILLYYICSLQKPFELYSTKDHFEKVVLGGERPTVPTWWPKSLQRLVTQCWSPFPSDRPAMEDVVRQLQRMATTERHVATVKSSRIVPIAVTVSSS